MFGTVNNYIYQIKEKDFFEQFTAPLSHDIGDTFHWLEVNPKTEGRLINVKVMEIDHVSRIVACKEV